MMHRIFDSSIRKFYRPTNGSVGPFVGRSIVSELVWCSVVNVMASRVLLARYASSAWSVQQHGGTA